MSKKPKKKKKYVPKAVLIPKLVSGVSGFDPFEAAINRIIETGEILIDENDQLYYLDFSNRRLSLETSALIVCRYLEYFGESRHMTIDTQPINDFLIQLKEKSLDEETIEAVLTLLGTCRVAYRSMPHQQSNQILKEINDMIVGNVADRKETREAILKELAEAQAELDELMAQETN